MDTLPVTGPPHAAAARAAPAALPWTLRKPAIPRPLVADYGYLDEHAFHASTRDALLARARARQALPLVWTPHDPYLAWPEEVPELFEVMRAAEREGRRKGVWLPLGVFAVMAVLALQSGSMRSAAYLFAILALVWAGVRIHAAFRSGDITPEDVRGDAEMGLHGAWLRERHAQWTRWLSALLIGVGVAQVAVGIPDSVEIAGLHKPSAWAGQWWRLFTATLLHGGALHFFFNFTALQSIGRLTENHAHRIFLPLVFLVTALTGSVASLLLTEGTSVGASGGLMGLIGFLAVLGYARRRVVPAGFARMMVMDIALVGIIGLLGAAFIDNAGHAGGLVGGAVLGALLIPRDQQAPGVGWVPSAVVRAAGTAALALLTVGAAATALLLISMR